MQKQLKKALHDLQEEKEMNRCLLENQAIWQQKVTGLESQIRDLAQTKDKVPNIYIIFFILYVLVNIFLQSCRDRSSWIELVLSRDLCVWQQKVTGLESQIRDLAQTKDKVATMFTVI